MYAVLRTYVRVGLRLYLGRIHVDRRTAPPAGTALLIASNHPNAFLDALVIAALLPYRTHYLAPGDAFRKPWAIAPLRALGLMPVAEVAGSRDLVDHGNSLSAVHRSIANGGSLLVFAEGRSEIGNALRPLRKTTARIALRAWEAGAALPVLPVWLRYDPPHGLYMDLYLATAPPLLRDAIEASAPARSLIHFNAVLHHRLQRTADSVEAERARSATPGHPMVRTLLVPPAVIGWLLHAPWYYPVRALAAARTRGTAYGDSVRFTLLLLSYPVWTALLTVVAWMAGARMAALLVPVLVPLFAAALRKYRIMASRTA